MRGRASHTYTARVDRSFRKKRKNEQKVMEICFSASTPNIPGIKTIPTNVAAA